MSSKIVGIAALVLLCRAAPSAEPTPVLPVVAAFQQSEQDQKEQQSAEHASVRDAIRSYVEVFNQKAPSAVADRWTRDGVSVDQETGERTVGREALTQRFAGFFESHPDARLTGRVESVRLIRPDVAQVDGVAMLLTGETGVESAFSAVLIREGGQWLISSSHERDLPAPPSPADALKDLEWLIGVWEDQTEGARVTTTVRWSASRAFLLRSFSADYGDGSTVEGTQVIGWDPLNRQVRTWTFHSDGSFAQGTASRNGDSWMVKMTHVLNDGSLAEGTQIITRVNDDTISVQTIGQTIDGEPVPASEPVTVVRIGGSDSGSSTNGPANKGVER